MVSLLAALILAQQAQPVVGVVVSRSSAVAPARTTKLLARLEQQLADAQVKTLSRAEVTTRLGRLGLKDAVFCAGKRACLAELGRQLPADVVIGLSLAFLKPDLSVVVEAVRSSDGSSLADFSLVLGQGDKESLASFEVFATRLQAALRPKAEPLPEVPPKVTTDTPLATDPLTTVTAPPMPPAETRSVVPALVTAGVGAVALATGIGLTASALGKNASLSKGTPLGDGRIQSPLTESQALAARNGANTELTIGIGCAIGTVALGVLTYFLWPRSPSP